MNDLGRDLERLADRGPRRDRDEVIASALRVAAGHGADGAGWNGREPEWHPARTGAPDRGVQQWRRWLLVAVLVVAAGLGALLVTGTVGRGQPTGTVDPAGTGPTPSVTSTPATGPPTTPPEPPTPQQPSPTSATTEAARTSAPTEPVDPTAAGAEPGATTGPTAPPEGDGG